ncbi:MAG: TRAP transporter fused permease subunit [Hydrogenophaga sp.]|uniref:TRAP transporter permease n=1 Tax=Hydrogenophaga sp. TaxID=1904254 RepID=UPI00168FCBC0|nr:TRAP transporter permease [Hydrogenophaga sp.]NIM43987.1 TRAP transporter fused permease subunit [Hydrogenophaga sp.]NIN29048.1 TRAP transporter fused permease subunit [Hydrogenophaga sp.]NIN33525.1 TRAP transporter fused permease subunit [Hydrogenophaga sp.]NIN58190.1 TRAP transporter fused permease subunit [Hydrogenophaga sp.]NIO54488.1 TRAP transporter fused permease subunit [Hydrogenophaga sp.]
MSTDIEKAPEALQQLVADSDTGGRKPSGITAGIIFTVSLLWALFQFWYASPLPFELGFGILNDTEARAIHLAFALFLAFMAWPAFKRSPRAYVPIADWVLALAGAFAAAYLMLFYAELATRPGTPNTMDIVVATVGLVLLLEATRRAVGWPMAALALIFIAYSMLGPWLPEVLAHKGASLNRLLSHMWLTTEGVFGIALGVSAGTIFVYVLFGALLDRAGGGNYMMQVSFAALGHLRGGPAKVAVVSSALNGMISGSSVSNVVSGGIFTIPLMKKAGYGGVKAGAIETMSSVNGQIMPPVMGAAAFLMVEYVGIPYAEIVKHAFLPATLSYIGLLYIVHLEALKLGMNPIVQAVQRPWRIRVLRNLIGISGSIAVVCAIYYLIMGINAVLGAAASYAVSAVVLALYLFSVYQAAKSEDLPEDIDIENPKPLQTWPTVRAGLHYILPIAVLIWCLMVEVMSPALSAFWAVVTLVVLMLTQKPLIALFRGVPASGAWKDGWDSVVQGFTDGSRNMIGIGVATATAGVIVGAITLTGLGLRMTEFVEFVAQGNVMAMLLFIAFVCLVLGLGVPTTANYVLVATLMAPVVVELGAQSGLIIPLIAVHLFVFYYGIMGDITPPVGLATFAAAAISGEDSIKTGVQGAVYALRTVILPFIWIFNPQLLLIDVHGWGELIRVIAACTLATLVFAAVTMNWFRVKNHWWETVLLAIAVVLLFRPDAFMDRLYAPNQSVSPARVYDVARDRPANDRVVMVIQGLTLEGDDVVKTVAVQLGEAGDDGRKRLADAGLQLMPLGDQMQIGAIKFGSRAAKSGFEQGWDVKEVLVPSDRPTPHWFYLPALLLVALVWWNQGRRMKPGLKPAVA